MLAHDRLRDGAGEGRSITRLIEARNISFAYDRERPVLQGVNAAFPPASLTVVLGPNGAGKSTLLRLLAGVAKPDAGCILMDGKPLQSMKPCHRAARVALIPQHSSLAFAFTLAEVVQLGFYAQGRPPDPASVHAALTLVSLEKMSRRPFLSLSAGQRQRGTLARAMLQLGLHASPHTRAQSPILLADEPVSAMDPAHALRAMDLLRTLARGGACVVAVLHDLSLALRYADRALLLSAQGEVVAEGPAPSTITPTNLMTLFNLEFVIQTCPLGKPLACLPAAFVHS